MTGTFQDEDLNAELTKLEKKYNLFAGLSVLSFAVIFFLFLFISQDWQYKILAATLIIATISSAGSIVYYYKYLKRHRDLFSHYYNRYNRHRLRAVAQSECPNCSGEKIIYVEWWGKVMDIHTRCINCDYDYEFWIVPMAIQLLFMLLPVILLAFGLFQIFGFNAVDMDTTVDVSILFLSMIYCLLVSFTLPWAANAAAIKTQFARRYIDSRIIANLAHEEKLKNEQSYQETIKKRFAAANRFLLIFGIISFILCFLVMLNYYESTTDNSRYYAPITSTAAFLLFMYSNRKYNKLDDDIEDILDERIARSPQVIQVMMLVLIYFITYFMI